MRSGDRTNHDARKLRRHTAREYAPFLLVLLATTCVSRSAAQRTDDVQRENASGFRRLTRVLDFDERSRGNFEKLPVNWARLAGPGLPAFLEGRIDDAVGHDAAPSFRLDLQTGNLGYEYRALDLTVVPGSDYLLVGWIRAAGLKFARAFVAARFVNRFGEPLPGSDAISTLVASRGQDDEPWQRVELRLRGDYPTAHAIHLELWILQSSVWKEFDPRAPDPIEEADVNARAWFDDLAIYRLPRARLSLSTQSGLVHSGEKAWAVVEMTRALAQALSAEVTIFDVNSNPVATRGIPLDEQIDSPSESDERDERGPRQAMRLDELDATITARGELPTLPVGTYSLRLRLRSGNETVVERWAKIAVLPELTEDPRSFADIAVDLPRWTPGESSGVLELFRELRCGTVRLGIPMVGPVTGAEKINYFRDLTVFLRDLASARIESVGVIQVPTGDSHFHLEPTRGLIRQPQRWQTEVTPVLSNLGGALTTWQLGDERVELADGARWTAPEIEQVRRQLRRYSSVPRLIVPQSVISLTPETDDPPTVLIPAEVPTRHIPEALHEAAELRGDRWLNLEFAPRGGRSYQDWVTDMARRVVLAKASNAEHLCVTASAEPVTGGRSSGWQPTEGYLPLRTLIHFLGGRRAVAAMEPAPGVTAIVFAGGGKSCIAVWSWNEDAEEPPVELYMGDLAVAWDLFGTPTKLEVRNGRARIQPTAAPVFIEASNMPLVLLQASYSVAPLHIEGDHADPPPILTFANPYGTAMSGEVLVTPPNSWQVEPVRIPFDLPPGGVIETPLEVNLPPRQLAMDHPLGVKIMVRSPENETLEFEERFRVGLKDITLDTKARWRGDDLLIAMSLRNLSASPVSFTAFCAPPGVARAEGVFLGIGPDESGNLQFTFTNARRLAGGAAYVGIQEIRGERTMNQLVDIPR